MNSSNAVFGMGHAAVLIGNDKDGWRYLSMNGTGDGAAPFGESKNYDLGSIKAGWDFKKKKWIGNDFRETGLTASQVMKAVNKSNIYEEHHYDRAIRIRTSGFEDEIAYQAAKKQASGLNYNIFGSSCVDVPQEAFESVVANRFNIQSHTDPHFWSNHLGFFDADKYGFHMLTPNNWFDGLLGNGFGGYINNINSNLNDDFNYYEVHESPRYK